MCLFRFVCPHAGAVGAVDRPRHSHEVHDHQENAPSEQVIGNDEGHKHGRLQIFLCQPKIQKTDRLKIHQAIIL